MLKFYHWQLFIHTVIPIFHLTLRNINSLQCLTSNYILVDYSFIMSSVIRQFEGFDWLIDDCFLGIRNFYANVSCYQCGNIERSL